MTLSNSYTMLNCLSVCLIGPNFFMATHTTPAKDLLLVEVEIMLLRKSVDIYNFFKKHTFIQPNSAIEFYKYKEKKVDFRSSSLVYIDSENKGGGGGD